MHKYEIRTRTFLDLRKHLDQNGADIEKAIQLIKNSAVETLKQRKTSAREHKTQDLLKYGGWVATNKTAVGGNESGQGLDLDDLISLCRAQNFDVDPQNVLAPIMDTFEKDIFGEVPCSEFIAQFKGVLRDGEEEKQIVEANRYFSETEDIFKEVAFEIQDRKMKDFGSFLKGNDINHDGMIPRANFY